MNPRFRHRTAAVIASPALAAVTALAAPARVGAQAQTQSQAQTLSFKVNDNIPYTIKLVDGFPPKVNSDGMVTVRVIVTLNAVRIPDGYNVSSTSVTKTPGKATGSSLQGKPVTAPLPTEGDDPGHVRSDGTSAQAAAVGTPPKDDTPTINFNALRDDVSRADQEALRNSAFTFTKGDDPSKAVVKDVVALFAYGDWLYNTRLARATAWYGANWIDFSGYKSGLDKLKLVRDPTNPTSADTDAFTNDNLRKDVIIEWDDNVVQANTPNASTQMNGKKMITVQATCVVEATFDPKSPPAFPLLSSTTPASAANAKNSAGAQNNAGPVQNQAAETPPAASTLLEALFPGNVLGLKGSVADTPGLEPLVGLSWQNTGPQTLFGINITRTVKQSDLDDSFKNSLIDISIKHPLSSPRTGFIFGHSGSGQNNAAWIAGLSHKIHPYVIAYIGTATGSNLNRPRFSPSLGVAFNLSKAFTTTPPASTTSVVQVQIQASASPMITPCVIENDAALLWVADATNKDAPIPKDKRLEVSIQQNGQTPSTAYKDYVRDPKTYTDNASLPWVTWVGAGTLLGMTQSNTDLKFAVQNADGSAVPMETRTIKTVEKLAGTTWAAMQPPYYFDKGQVYRITYTK